MDDIGSACAAERARTAVGCEHRGASRRRATSGLDDASAVTGHVEFPSGSGAGGRVLQPPPEHRVCASPQRSAGVPPELAPGAPAAWSQTPGLYHGGQSDNCTAVGGETSGSCTGLDSSELSVDWLSVTGLGCSVEGVRGVLREVCGPVAEHRNGRGGYERGDWWPNGAELSSGQSKTGRWWLQLPGGACRAVGLAGVLQIGRVAMFGGSCTRLDVRRDLFGKGLSLVRDAWAGCEAGQLRRARNWQPYPKFSADGDVIGEGIVFGSTLSEAFVRCYDKGLETGQCPRSEWIRWEAQLRRRFAHEGAKDLFRTEDLSVIQSVIMRLLSGTVDFRVGPRGQGVQVERLERPAWWTEFLGTCAGDRLAVEGVEVSALDWSEAFRRQYGQMLVLVARELGKPVEVVSGALLAALDVSPGTRRNPVGPVLAWHVRSLLTGESQVDTVEQ